MDTDGWCWEDANRLRKLRERLDRLIVERADLRRRLAARREITSILETNLQERLKRTEAEDEEFKERVKAAAQTKELEARDERFNERVNAAAGTMSAEERKTARTRQWKPTMAERFKEEDKIEAAAEATNAKDAKEGKGVAKIKAAEEAGVAAEAKATAKATATAEAKAAARGQSS